MAFIISAGDVKHPVDGMSRRQPWHADVVDGHAISLVSLLENLVVHRGMDCPAAEPRVLLFLTSLDANRMGTGGSYDQALQYTRYQFPLALWLLEDALYWLYKDRVDVPTSGLTYGEGGPLSTFMNAFVAAATAADIAAGRTTAQRRTHEPDDALLLLKAKQLAPMYKDFIAASIKQGDFELVTKSRRFPPTWAQRYFQK